MDNNKSIKKFKSLETNEMSEIQGGWRLFGKETVTGTTSGSIVGNAYSTNTTTYTYIFGFHGSGEAGMQEDGWD